MNVAHYLEDLGIANFEFECERITEEATSSNASPATTLVENSTKIPIAAEVINTRVLIVEKPNAHSFSKDGNTKNLLSKMLASIGVDMQSTTLISSKSIEDLSNTYNAEITILAGDFEEHASDYFVIPHPQQILENPDFKRDAWEVLKKIKEHL